MKKPKPDLPGAIAQVSIWVQSRQRVSYRELCKRFYIGKEKAQTAIDLGREAANQAMAKRMRWPARCEPYAEWRR